MKITTLKNHKVVNYITPISSQYIRRHDPDNKLIKVKPTNEELLAIDFLFSIGNIMECMDQLYFTVELLSGFRKRKNSLFNRTDYIIYMIENFYLRITSIHDRCLILTNKVFDIGLPDKECKDF